MDSGTTLYTSYDRHYARFGNVRPAERIFLPALYHDYDRPWMKGLAKDAAILDCGCGYGHQLYALSKMGFTNLTGIELTEGSYAIAKLELSGMADVEHAEAFDYLRTCPGQFDLILLNDVLEHVPREKTLEFLQLIRDALRPQGMVTIRVPNMASLLAQHSMYGDFTHLVGFTEFSLTQILDIAGFVDHRFVSLRPKLFLNYRYPAKVVKSLGRFALSVANDFLHRFLYLLRLQRPIPTQFGYNIEVYSGKGP